MKNNAMNKQGTRERFEIENKIIQNVLKNIESSTIWNKQGTQELLVNVIRDAINLALQEQQEELNYIKKEFNELSERYNKQRKEIIKKIENEAKKYYSQERNLIGNAIDDIILIIKETNTE